MSRDDDTSPNFAHPRYWPVWVAIGAMYLAAWLPWRLKLWVGRGIGLAAWRLARRRRHITETNLRLCFPELDDAAHARLVRETFIANGIGIMETATGWCRDPEHLRHRVTFKGQEHMARVQAEGRGALIIGVHFSTLDLGGALHSLFFPADVVYRPHDNPLFERFMTRARSRIFGTAIDRHDLRGVVRRIKAGHHVWYSPDQDFGRDVSVFAPFFGRPAYTATLLPKLVARTEARVVTGVARRIPGQGFELHFLPADERVYSPDEAESATGVNACVEAAIALDPAQYQWEYKRYRKVVEEQQGVPNHQAFRLY